MTEHTHYIVVGHTPTHCDEIERTAREHGGLMLPQHRRIRIPAEELSRNWVRAPTWALGLRGLRLDRCQVLGVLSKAELNDELLRIGIDLHYTGADHD